MTVSDRSIYSIGALARMIGVSPATLRSWEERYGLVVPERSAGSQAVNSLDQSPFARAGQKAERVARIERWRTPAGKRIRR